MLFNVILENLLGSIDGAAGAILADWEGEAVAQAARMDDYELRVLGAHQGIILEQLRTSLARLDHEPQEVVIAAKRFRVLILPITGEYFLVVVLDRQALVGPALFRARQTLQQLKSEID